MQFSKFLACGVVVILPFMALSGDEVFNTKKADEMAQRLRSEKWVGQDNSTSTDTSWVQGVVEQAGETSKSLKANGSMDQFAVESVEAKVKVYEKAAQQLVDNTYSRLDVELQKHAGLTSEEASLFNPDYSDGPKSHFAIFISFSMSEAEIKDALSAAQSAGAQVYLKGLRKGDESIMDTMTHLQRLTLKMDEKPYTRFNPAAFEQFQVTQVPTILYHENGKTYTARGITNLRWLKGHSLDNMESQDFGSYGPTKPVLERSIIEDIQSRIASYDFEAEKKRTVDSFWKRKKFVTLPNADKSEVWFIDPTVRVTADVRNPRGDLLARAGDIINPLATMTAVQNFMIFDATNVKHLEWATAAVSSPQLTGPVMLMTSTLNSENGWEHLAAIRKHFGKEIYLLPKELVDKFKLSALPAIITPELQKQVFRIEQIKLEERL
jgi:conjugal transfer pilus assembly protein TraW